MVAAVAVSVAVGCSLVSPYCRFNCVFRDVEMIVEAELDPAVCGQERRMCIGIEPFSV